MKEKILMILTSQHKLSDSTHFKKEVFKTFFDKHMCDVAFYINLRKDDIGLNEEAPNFPEWKNRSRSQAIREVSANKSKFKQTNDIVGVAKKYVEFCEYDLRIKKEGKFDAFVKIALPDETALKLPFNFNKRFKKLAKTGFYPSHMISISLYKGEFYLNFDFEKNEIECCSSSKSKTSSYRKENNTSMFDDYTGMKALNIFGAPNHVRERLIKRAAGKNPDVKEIDAKAIVDRFKKEADKEKKDKAPVITGTPIVPIVVPIVVPEVTAEDKLPVKKYKGHRIAAKPQYKFKEKTEPDHIKIVKEEPKTWQEKAIAKKVVELRKEHAKKQWEIIQEIKGLPVSLFFVDFEILNSKTANEIPKVVAKPKANANRTEEQHQIWLDGIKELVDDKKELCVKKAKEKYYQTMGKCPEHNYTCKDNCPRKTDSVWSTDCTKHKALLIYQQECGYAERLNDREFTNWEGYDNEEEMPEDEECFDEPLTYNEIIEKVNNIKFFTKTELVKFNNVSMKASYVVSYLESSLNGMTKGEIEKISNKAAAKVTKEHSNYSHRQSVRTTTMEMENRNGVARPMFPTVCESVSNFECSKCGSMIGNYISHGRVLSCVTCGHSMDTHHNHRLVTSKKMYEQTKAYQEAMNVYASVGTNNEEETW